jgi:hypothetical protein
MLGSIKVTRDTPDQLIVADTPWLLSSALIFFIMVFMAPALLLMFDGVWQGAIFALAGGGLGLIAFAVFVRRTQLILDIPSDSVTLRWRTLFGFNEVRHTLSNLARAELETTQSSKGSALCRPVLILSQGMSAGPHPIIPSYTNTKRPRRLVDAVNSWLTKARLDSGTPNA